MTAMRKKMSTPKLRRDAVGERDIGGTEQRRAAMRAIVGIWKSRAEFSDPEPYIREMRRGSRIERLNQLS